MGFEIVLVNAPPASDAVDVREAQAGFFTHIGYHSEEYEPRTKARNIYESVPFRIFSDYFLKSPSVPHKVDDVASQLKTTVATVYRHLNKIKRLDILEEVELGSEDSSKPLKGYMLRYGSFSLAWRFAETDIAVCLERYRALVDELWARHGRGGGGGASSAPATAGDDGGAEVGGGTVRIRGSRPGPPFRLHVVDTVIDAKKEEDRDLLLLTSLDYLSPRGIHGKSERELRKGIGYRLFVECFLERADRLWSYDELCLALDTTFPTVSRYINKMRALDILDEVPLERGEDETPKKGFRLRHGDLSKAWGITEAQSRTAVKNYRKSVEHLDGALRE